jgi:hypothetical protein
MNKQLPTNEPPPELAWDPVKLALWGAGLLVVIAAVAPFYIAFWRIIMAWTTSLIKTF